MANTKYNPANAGRSDFDRLFSAADDTAELVTEVHTARGTSSSLDDRLDASDEKILDIQTDILTNIKPDITGLEEGVERNAAAITELGDTDSLHTASLYRLIDSSAKNRFLITAESSSATYGNFTVTFDPVFGHVSFEATAANETDTTIYLDRDDCAQDYSGCVLSGCPAGGSESRYELRTATDSVSDFGSGVEITSNTPTRIAIIIRAGCNPNGLVFMPMICWKSYWTMSHVFDPYCPPQSQMYREINGDIAAEARARQAADTKQNAALTSLIDGGAKNAVNLYGYTYYVSDVGVHVDANASMELECSGTCLRDIYIAIKDIQLAAGKYVISGIQGSTTANSYFLSIEGRNGATGAAIDYGTGAEFTAGGGEYRVYLRIRQGMNMDNIKIKPMICKKSEFDISHEFAPYCPAMPELYQMILALQSGSRSIEPALENSGEEER